ncbi:MAG: glycerol-3-phosphate dehydrogenase [Acidobacteria bacterium]|nr:MAG: glycerol-3-phosphate dehydrogenase [Acidobacteriota bacterium]
MSRIAIIGAGAWGTGLAIVLGRKGGHEVRLWAHEPEVCESITQRRVNELFLPAQAIPENVHPTNSFADATRSAEIVVGVMPSHHCRAIFEKLCSLMEPSMLLVSATKGLENGTLLRMTEVVSQVVSEGCGFTPRVGALSGPTFAKEVARGDPTAITIASHDAELQSTIQREFSGPTFRVYTSDDLIGVELGDRSVGVELGKGRKLPDIIAGMHGMVAEGVFTTGAAVELAKRYQVEMPITQQMHSILNSGKSPREAIQELMLRSAKRETEFHS